MLVALLSRFWFDLAPSMGRADSVRRSQQIALTLKIKGGLQLTCKPHSSGEAAAGKAAAGGAGGAGGRAARAAGAGASAVARAASGALGLLQ